DDLPTVLSGTVDRMGDALDGFRWRSFGGDDKDRFKVVLAAAIARASAGASDFDEAKWSIGQMLEGVHESLGRADLEALIPSEAPGRPGLWTLADPAVRYRHDTGHILTTLLSSLEHARLEHASVAAQTRAARFAQRLTEVVAKLDGDYDTP